MVFGILSQDKRIPYVDLVTCTDDMRKFQVHYFQQEKMEYDSFEVIPIDETNRAAHIASISIVKEAALRPSLLVTYYKELGN